MAEQDTGAHHKFKDPNAIEREGVEVKDPAQHEAGVSPEGGSELCQTQLLRIFILDSK